MILSAFYVDYHGHFVTVMESYQPVYHPQFSFQKMGKLPLPCKVR